MYRGALRSVATATPNKKTVVIYGSTEAEPISVIFAEEKMRLEKTCPDGLCVGMPVFKETVKVIRIQEGCCCCIAISVLLLLLLTAYPLLQVLLKVPYILGRS